jgi:hypothetical protein
VADTRHNSFAIAVYVIAIRVVLCKRQAATWDRYMKIDTRVGYAPLVHVGYMAERTEAKNLVCVCQRLKPPSPIKTNLWRGYALP